MTDADWLRSYAEAMSDAEECWCHEAASKVVEQAQRRAMEEE